MSATTTENPNAHTAPAPPNLGNRADTIRTEKIDWLLPEMIARGQVNEIVGDPDKGKTLFAIDVAAHVSTGAAWSDWSACPHGHVLFFSAEDDERSTLVPRLIAAGADLANVTIISMLLDDPEAKKPVPVNFPAHLALLEKVIRALAVKLIIFDPLSAYVSSKLDLNKETQARFLYGLIGEIARRNAVAILILGHLNKNAAVGNASYRTIGSIARTAAPRTSYLVDFDPADRDADLSERRRIVARIKNNLSKARVGITFKIESVNVTLDTGGTADVPRVTWTGSTKLTADEVLSLGDPARRKAASEIDTAREFLKAALAAGPRAQKEIEASASDAGISERTLKRARKELGVESHKDGLGPWLLALPGTLNGNGLRRKRQPRKRNAHLHVVTDSSAEEGQTPMAPK